MTHDTTADAVERVNKAIDEAWDLTFDGDMIGVRRVLSSVRATIAAMPPVAVTEAMVEEVLLAGRYSINDIQFASGQWRCDLDQFDESGNYRDEYWRGTGPTIDAAIRDAVRRATEANNGKA